MPPPVAAGEASTVAIGNNAEIVISTEVNNGYAEPAVADLNIDVTSQDGANQAPVSDLDSPVCELYVRCDTILTNIENLIPDKTGLVPDDGVIFSSAEVFIDDGDSVFDVLLREMKRERIHFEFSGAAALNTIYIKGINNLYEFDCGALSGWTFKVNGAVPGIGCSMYLIQPGDVVEILYTCDLGLDVGGDFAE